MKALALTAVAAMVSIGLLVPPAAATTTAAARLPDLGMAPLRDFRIDTTGGKRLLRFSAEIVNVGTGRFELQGRRSATTVPEMSVRQRIFKVDGTRSWRRTDAAMFFAGDGHDHWHVKDLERYTIHSIANDAELGRAAKTGFCFSDNAAYRLSLPGAPQSGAYMSCGVPSSTAVTMGLSVGWGDVYTWDLAWQWIDISGLAPGDYVVRARADPQAMFTEATVANNMTWTRIRVSASNPVTVLAQGPAA